MKLKNYFRAAFMAVVVMASLQSCNKEDEVKPEKEEATFSVRPDFATLDTRPSDIISASQVTGEFTKPVELSNLKGTGKYALVIGISDYNGNSSDLQYCDDDAVDWYYRLQKEGYSIRYLLDGNATSENIQSEVNYLASLSKSGNEIAFCYSGHGSAGNIISSDFDYISYSWFKRTFANSTSSKMMFCFDACQIGDMKALDASGRIVAVASNESVYAYDGTSDMKNGVFTYYMMKGFDSKGYKYLEEDCEYAIDNMEKWGYNNGLTVVPSYVDSYSGKFDL
ncbi:caspase family protein [Saccharicrinis aurantiacus]|uniref:caspase family protein n=1 Tax=Saccharicrinis aurantiacus TaxID=1849719 RepID=UPI00094F9004|nr:caspase family protein [Saccharicrinis aurantiacus]